MTIQEAIQKGLKKVRQPNWQNGDCIELPYIDPFGNQSQLVRIVSGNEGYYERISILEQMRCINISAWQEIPEEQPDLPEILNLTTPSVPFDVAKNYILKFGPPEFVGLTLDQVARTNKGLRYLDNVVDKEWLHSDTREMIKTYLSNDGIKRDLENLIQ